MRHRGEAGFTLVEVLVALVMSALMVVILLDGSASANRRDRQARVQSRAVFLARSLLTQAAVADYGAFPPTGVANALHWTIAEQMILADPHGLYGLVQIHVAIAGDDGETLFAADTRRLKRIQRS